MCRWWGPNNIGSSRVRTRPQEQTWLKSISPREGAFGGSSVLGFVAAWIPTSRRAVFQTSRLAVLIFVLLALPAKLPGRADAKGRPEHRFTFTIRAKWDPATRTDSANCGDLPRDAVLKELTRQGAAHALKDPSI